MQLVIAICAKLLLVIIIIYLFIYLFIHLFIYLFFAGRFSAFCFSAPNQNVSHDILNALGGFGSYKVFS